MFLIFLILAKLCDYSSNNTATKDMMLNTTIETPLLEESVKESDENGTKSIIALINEDYADESTR